MLRILFRPKWQHRKAQVRLAALHDLSASDPVLLRVAREDSETSVRQQAVRLTRDLEGLFVLHSEVHDLAVREAAGRRIKRLLAGQEEDLPLAHRLDHLGRCTEEEITAYVLQNAVETELRHAALAAVNRPSLLAEVALNDSCAALRLAAVERLDRPATLERVARAARGKDKHVSRRAKEKLEAERTAQLRPQRQAGICEAIEALVRQGGVDLVALRRRKEEWDDLLPPADPGVAERFQSACTAFDEAHARVQAEAAAIARTRELCERSEQLLQELEQQDADLPALEEAIGRMQREWQALAEAASLNSGLVERFNDAMARAGRRHAERLRECQETARLQALLERLEAMTKATPGTDALQRIESEWQAAGGERRQPHTAALCERFSTLLQRTRDSLAEQDNMTRALQQEYDTLLGQLEAALGEGQVQQATACRDRLADREKKLAALGGRTSGGQQRRMKLANARLQELRDWRRFGTDNARDELLARLAELQSAPLEPLEQAKAIKSVRAAWKGLDRKDGIAADALRQAFEEAAEAAYAPCREFYDEQERQREEHLAQRRCFIAELEQEYGAIDWEQPDWAALEQRLAQAQKRWPDLGGVPRADWQELNTRFKRALAAFEQRLSARRESEKRRREALIHQVEALAEEPDLEKALAAVRKAQADWRPDVCCPQRVEQALWHRFKAAGDAVYARQKAKAAAQRREAREQQAHCEGLCQQAEALAAEARERPGPALARLAELQQQWQAEGARRSKVLQQRFDAAGKAVRQAVGEARRRQAAAGRERLVQKAALCQALERLLFAPAREESAQLAAAWREFGALPDARLDGVLTARFDRAAAQLNADTESAGLAAAAQENLDKCRALCLQLELLAGVDSPQEFAEERLALQVQLLADAMTGQVDPAQRQARIDELLAAYFSLGPLLSDAAAAMLERIGAVLAASN